MFPDSRLLNWARWANREVRHPLFVIPRGSYRLSAVYFISHLLVLALVWAFAAYLQR